MKIADILIGEKVKRSAEWIKEIKEDAYLKIEEETETGAVEKIDGDHIVVLWSFTGLSWEDPEDLIAMKKR
ncbi:MAG TPA: hypothetical protein EYN67_06710 [Flavobacteriales bacterium]|nr:hypothetical protein [Flavobacteriales bacterium]